jgi:hypothetical protein
MSDFYCKDKVGIEDITFGDIFKWIEDAENNQKMLMDSIDFIDYKDDDGVVRRYPNVEKHPNKKIEIVG